MSNAEKIRDWREAHPGERITVAVLKDTLNVDSLRGADLWEADLRKADLQGADLRGADLREADLWGADLRGADLRGADLRGVYLWGADLQHANLQGANLQHANLRAANLSNIRASILEVNGLPSGQAILTPTPDGWFLRVGCWTGQVIDLEAMIATDEDWPEAVGEECARRRPGLEALITLCHAHMDLYPHLIHDLRATWAHQDTTTKKEDQ